MNKSPIILFLYSEIGPYNLPVFSELVHTFNAEVHVVRWDEGGLKPYEPNEIEGVSYYKRSKLDEKKLTALIESINPDLVYISGWMDNLYLKCVLPCRVKGVPVVSGFDDIWIGSVRQRIGVYYFKLCLKKYFSHAWVAGEPQFEFARRLGFPRQSIVFDLLSADVSTFSNSKYNGQGNDFLYVGNFRSVKGTTILGEAFKYYKNELNGKLGLVCIGNGELENYLKKLDGVKVLPYMHQAELIKQVNGSAAFILPSIHDQWGVVVHEFSTAGLPLIMSNGVGASSRFLINGYNGYLFENKDIENLAHRMKKFEGLSFCERMEMSYRSVKLGQRINPQTSAANLMAILN